MIEALFKILFDDFHAGFVGAVVATIVSLLVFRFKLMLPHRMTQEKIIDFQLVLRMEDARGAEGTRAYLPKYPVHDTVLAEVLNNDVLVDAVVKAKQNSPGHVVRIPDLEQRELVMNALEKSVNTFFSRDGILRMFAGKAYTRIPIHLVLVREDTVNGSLLHMLVIRQDMWTALEDSIAAAEQACGMTKRLVSLCETRDILRQEATAGLGNKQCLVRASELILAAEGDL